MKNFMCIILGIVLIFGLVGCTADTSSSSTPKLTLEKYEAVQNGMTYDEVIEIIGLEGTEEAATGEKDTALYTVSYRYMGDQVKGDLGANASFMYQGGVLNTKAQLGLSN